MIDYEKLREAHRMAEIFSNERKGRMVFICVGFPINEEQFIIDIFHDGIKVNNEDDYFSLDELITKLKKLTQPEPKTFSGWVIDGFGNIEEWHGFTEDVLKDCDLNVYPTKSALIEAQIQYWQSLRDQSEVATDMVPASEGDPKGFSADECKHMLSESSTHDLVRWCNDCSRWGWFREECQHKPSLYGMRQVGSTPDTEFEKCIKCGEFYQ